MLQDLRQALRSLSRTPWLAAGIVASLALGSGATAAVYSAVDALLFRAPAGIDDPASLVDIYTSQMNGATYGASSYPDFLSVAALRELSAAAAIEERNEAGVRLGDTVTMRRVAAVSSGFWDLLRMSPHLGAWPTGGQAAVVSFDAWQALGADAALVGRAITIDGRSYTVGAIAPRGFRGLHLERIMDVWIPLDTATAARGSRRLRIVGRLAPAATTEQLGHALVALARELADAHPDTNRGTIRSADEPRRLTATDYSRLSPAVRPKAALLSTILLGTTGLLLVSACVNAGSLLLSRGLARRTELTIRTALGAERARLVRQILIESLILTLCGVAAGLIVAAWTAGMIPALFAPEHARLVDTHVRPLAIAAGMAASIAAGVLCGLGPAVLSTRALSPEVLRGDPAGVGEKQGGAGLRMVLVGAQLALSTIFLNVSGLLTTAVDSALTMDRTWGLGTVAIASTEGYGDASRDAAVARLRKAPSVAGAGWVATLPMARAARREFRIDRGENQEWVEIDVNFATAGYFPAMALPIVDGRLFRPQDDDKAAGVAVVNEALAARYFADRAVGRMLMEATGQTVEIVGVVRTPRYRAFEGAQQPMVYYPMSRSTARVSFAVVRSRYEAQTFEQDVPAALRAAGAAGNVDLFTFDAYLARALATDRLIVTLVGACGILALALASTGVYGVMSDVIRRRTREIGLRMALGAEARHIVGTYAGVTLAPLTAGVGAGVLGAAAIVQVGRSLVFGLPSLDPALIGAVAAGVTLSVLAAVAPPVRRALRVNPLVALRRSA